MAKNNAQPTQHSGFGALCRAAIIVGCGLTLSSASFALTLQDARLSIRTKQYKTAEQQLIELAKAGDSDAQYLLGSLYNSGQGVKRNYEKSAFWLTQAANQGDAKASYTLGVYYETGKGSTKNIEQAIEWYQKALEQGESKAEQRLAALKSSNALAPKAQSVSDLINLIRANDLFTLEKSLQTETQKGLVNNIDLTGHTPLIYAISRNNIQATTLLLNAGASPNTQNALGDTPLTFALKNQNDEAAKLLIKSGANINRTDNLENSPLHIATDQENIALVKLLLERKAKVNPKNKKSFTPLDYANSEEVRALLVGHGAKGGQLQAIAEFRSELTDAELAKNIALNTEMINDGNNPFRNWPPLNIAAWRGQLKHVNVLLKNDDTRSSINARDDSGLTPLMRGAWQGHIDIVNALIKQGANVNLVTEEGESALSLAVQANFPLVVDILVSNGATVSRAQGLEPLINIAAKKGNDEVAQQLLTHSQAIDLIFDNKTPLMWAAETGDIELLKALIAKKADLNLTDNLNRTALWLAVAKDQKTAVGILVGAGADTTLADSDGNTPLALASKKGAPAIAQQLVLPASVIDKANKQGNTPLMLAAQAGSDAIAQMLLKRGADIRARNNISLTPLMLAAQAGHLSMVKLLIAEGADIKRRNKDGKNAAELAEMAEQASIARYLKSQRRSFFGG